MRCPDRCGRTAALLLLLLAVLVAVEAGQDHYRVLGVSRTATDAHVKAAYRALAIKYHPDKNPSAKVKEKFLRIQAAYDVLGNAESRRKYDRHGDESDGARAEWQRQPRTDTWFGAGRQQRRWRQNIPSDTAELQGWTFDQTVFSSSRPWLIQVYHDLSGPCMNAAPAWEAAARELRPYADFGRINWGIERQLIHAIAGGRTGFASGFGMPINLDDLPVVLGRPAGCHSIGCLIKYRGRLMQPQLLQFLAERILRLPAVPVVTRTSLPVFLSGAPAHKVVVLAVSSAGRPASIPLRLAAQARSSRVHVGRLVLKVDQDRDFWRSSYGIRSAPALVFLHGPNTPPEVMHQPHGGKLDVAAAFAAHSRQVVPALRHGTAKELGCAWGGAGRRGDVTQLCLVLMGRHSRQLDEGRGAMAALRALLLERGAPSEYRAASDAARRGRLRITWLDAGFQHEFCAAHLRDSEGGGGGVCGGGWLSALPAALWRVGGGGGGVRLVAFKPGAGRLAQPHKYCVYEGGVGGDIDAVALADVAAWAAGCLQGDGVQLLPQPPPLLRDEDGPNFVVDLARRPPAAFWSAVEAAAAAAEPLRTHPTFAAAAKMFPGELVLLAFCMLGLVVLALVLASRQLLRAARADGDGQHAFTSQQQLPRGLGPVTQAQIRLMLDDATGDESAWVARLAEQHGLALLTQRDLATQGAQPAPPPLLAVLVLGVPLTAPAIVARRTTASDLGYEGEWELVDSSPEALQTAREGVRTFNEVQNVMKQVMQRVRFAVARPDAEQLQAMGVLLPPQGCAFVLARPSDAGGAWLPVELSLDAFVTANKLLSVLAPDRMQLFQSHRLEVPPQESIEI